LKLLCRHVLPHQRLSRYVAAGTRQAGNQALPNRIACIHNDRDRRGRLARGPGRHPTEGDDHVDFGSGEGHSIRGHSRRVVIGKAIFDGDILAVDPAQQSHAFSECVRSAHTLI